MKLKLIWVVILMIALSSCSENITDEKLLQISEPLEKVEEMPVFPGGEGELFSFIARNVEYPPEAIKKGIQGRVIIRFAVESDGKISRISILKGADPLLDEESLRIITSLPKFKPGRNEGKEVPVWMMVPITFTLK